MSVPFVDGCCEVCGEAFVFKEPFREWPVHQFFLGLIVLAALGQFRLVSFILSSQSPFQCNWVVIDVKLVGTDVKLTTLGPSKLFFLE